MEVVFADEDWSGEGGVMYIYEERNDDVVKMKMAYIDREWSGGMTKMMVV